MMMPRRKIRGHLLLLRYLTLGKHEISIVSEDGEANGDFTIVEEKTEEPVVPTDDEQPADEPTDEPVETTNGELAQTGDMALKTTVALSILALASGVVIFIRSRNDK